jgi:PAS domain-containing protein
VQDITDRKRAEKKLIKSEKKYKALFENMAKEFLIKVPTEKYLIAIKML